MHRTAHLGCNSCYRFHLYKENKDTQEALRVIGKMLGLQVPVCHVFIKIFATSPFELLNVFTYSEITCIIHSHDLLGLQGQRINVLLQPSRSLFSTVIYALNSCTYQPFEFLSFIYLDNMSCDSI